MPHIERLASIMGTRSEDMGHDHRSKSEDRALAHLKCPVCSQHDHDEYGKHRNDCARCKLLGTALTP
jgi:hypothetical protein